jgi:4-amino-4-deoxy-L-arabinose transferase-like glycosyltransferase
MLSIPRRSALTLFCFSVLFTVAVNEANLWYVRAENPSDDRLRGSSTMYGYTIWSADNSYYIPPIHNMLSGYGYIIDPQNPETRVLRTPGYALFYGLHYLLFGERGSFACVRVTQVVLLGLAAVLLADTLARLGSTRRVAVVAGGLFALCPYTAIYAYYTITESLYPFLLILVLNLFARAVEAGSLLRTALPGGALVLLVLTRPVTGILLPVLVVAWALVRPVPWTNRVLGAAVLAGSFGLGMVPWAVRNWMVTGGRFVPLEDYGVFIGFGEGFEAFRRWWSGWDPPGNAPIEYAKRVLAVLETDRSGDHAAIARERVGAFPRRAFSGTSPAEVERLILGLHGCWQAKLEALHQARPSSTNLRLAPPVLCDSTVKRQFDELLHRFRATSPLEYWVLTPLRIARETVAHSASYAYGSLNPPGRRWTAWQRAAKATMFALHLALFASLFYALHRDRLKTPLGFIVAAFPLAMLVFLIYGLRVGMEGRYLIAIYPFLYASLAEVLVSTAQWVQNETLF